MAIKVYGNKIVFPDGTEQTTASDVADTSYTKEEMDAQQEAQDVKIDKNASDLTNVYTKEEVDNSQSEQDTEIAKKIDDAPSDNDTYARNNSTWVSIGGSAGIPDAPVDGVMYGRKDGDWNPVADAGDVYTKTETNDLLDDKADKGDSYLKAESDATNQAQDSLIQANTDAINAIPDPVDTYTKDEIDASQLAQDTEIAKKQDTGVSYTKTEADTLLDNKSNVGDSYTKVESNTLLDNKANVGDSYLKTETYNNVEVDTKLFEKADKSTTYTKTEVDDSQALQNTEIAKKANQATTYTKDEVDELLESASGAIVGNYTNKHASGGVGRDPLAGNLYLSNGMSFSTDYNAVTFIYISDTDGDGDVRDFDEVQVSDKITLTSENGSGEYTIVTISDVGGYRELVVSTDSATGTIDDDTPVSIVLDVASSGETGGGIEEAPADGKQYARQDEAWTEVTGGGSTPTPEKFEWSRNLAPNGDAERDFNTKYTNDKGVPLYLSTYVWTASKLGYAELYIDDVNTTTVGGSNSTSANDGANYDNLFYIIPEGSTYELKTTGNCNVYKWHEARMPLAIAVGEASSGGTAQPPVAFSMYLTTPKENVPVNTETLIPLDTVELDTDSGVNPDGTYTVKKAGVYIVSFGSFISAPNNEGYDCSGLLKINDLTKLHVKLRMNGTTKGINVFAGGNTATLQLEAGDVLSVVTNVLGPASYIQNGTGGKAYNNFLSGHMVSSITEGEVKEKEAIAFNGKLSAEQSIPKNTYTKINIDTAEFDTNNALVDGKFKPSVAGYYQVNGSVHFTGSSFSQNTMSVLYKNGSQHLRGNSNIINEATSSAHISTVADVVYLDGVNDYIELYCYVRADNAKVSGYTRLSAHLITGQSSGGSGGGDYTPEKMVWSDDIKADRGFDKVFTNDNDVPLYVQLYVNAPANNTLNYADFYIDGERFGSSGANGNDGRIIYANPLYIVPAGSTYELRKGGNSELAIWHEARMPVAVGTGGKTVAFELGLSSDITTTPHGVWTQCALNNAITDTDSGADLSNNSYVVKTAGVYSLAFNHQVSNSTESLTKHYGRFEVNGTDVAYASSTGLSGNGNHPLSGSCVVNLNVGDVLTLHSYVSYSSGDCKQLSAGTRLMGNLVTSHSASGGSGGGDSIWQDVDGDAVLETKDKKLTIDANVGELGQRARIMTDTGQLDINVGAGGLPDVTITDGKLGIGTSSPTTSLNVSNDGTSYPVFDGYETQQVSNSQVAYTKWIQSGGIASHFGVDTEKGIMGTFSNHPLEIRTNNVGRMTIDSNGTVSIPHTPDTSYPANLHISMPDGKIYRSTATTYTTEEVDKKLAIKDKLIEKLSARLDKLEKKLK